LNITAEWVNALQWASWHGAVSPLLANPTAVQCGKRRVAQPQLRNVETTDSKKKAKLTILVMRLCMVLSEKAEQRGFDERHQSGQVTRTNQRTPHQEERSRPFNEFQRGLVKTTPNSFDVPFQRSESFTWATHKNLLVLI
jgi:hypothetical protein